MSIFIFYNRVVQLAARGPHPAREAICCGPRKIFEKHIFSLNAATVKKDFLIYILWFSSVFTSQVLYRVPLRGRVTNTIVLHHYENCTDYCASQFTQATPPTAYHPSPAAIVPVCY